MTCGGGYGRYAGVSPETFMAIWNRGGAKSTSAEMASVAAGARRARRYEFYICETQDQADDHVQNIGSMLESKEVAQAYPELSDRLLGKFGNARGWRRNRLRTASGYTIDALGLDSAARDVKLEDQRPDFMVIDDIDDSEDKPDTVRRKARTLTKKIIPAGSADLAVLMIQNLVHLNSVLARIIDGREDSFRRRTVSGPIPALEGFAYRLDEEGQYRITAGRPMWVGFDVDRCEDLLNKIGLDDFESECQHIVDQVKGALWSRKQLAAITVASAPRMTKVVVAVDPSGGDKEGNDAQGIIVVGFGEDGKAYVLADLTCQEQPAEWGRIAVQAFVDFEADEIVVEKNFGGDMATDTVKVAAERLGVAIDVVDVNVTRGKDIRAQPVAALYGRPDVDATWQHSRVLHVGGFPFLHEEQTAWTHKAKWSPNRIDGLVMAIHRLLLMEAEAESGFFWGS